MSNASPTAYLLWTILSVLFLGFLIYHLWSYDRFQCLRWSAGRQPGAFKRVMTYSYLASVPLFTIYSIAYTVLKYREGFVVLPTNTIFPRPIDMYSESSRAWVLPLNFILSFAWALELVTHLEELAFWLYLLHQTPEKGEWFESWEYRFWYWGSIVSIIGMPLTCMITRKNLNTVDAYIFLSGSCGSLSTTVAFLYVLWRFPRFIKHVKAEGADPTVVVRLATFYQLNLARVVFRFLFTVPLLMLAADGIHGKKHPLNSNLASTDFLLMIGGIGCFVSSAITLLIFFPRSILREAGYKPKPTSTSTVHHSPKAHSTPILAHAPSLSLSHAPSIAHSAPVLSPTFSPSTHSSGHPQYAGAFSHPQLHHIPSIEQLQRTPPGQVHAQYYHSTAGGVGMGPIPGPSTYEGDPPSAAVSPFESMVDVTTGGGGTIEEMDEVDEQKRPIGDAPPYFHAPGLSVHYQTPHDHPRDQHSHPRPHSLPYPQSPRSPPSPRPSRPQSQILLPTTAAMGCSPSSQEAPAQYAANILYQRHPFPHSLSSPQVPQNAASPPSSPAAVRVTMPPPARHPASPHTPAWTDSGGDSGVARRASSYVSAKPLLREGASELHYVRVSESERGRVREGWGWGVNREGFRRGAPRLHPYVMTFTSPIDLVDLSTPEELPGEVPSGRRSP